MEHIEANQSTNLSPERPFLPFKHLSGSSSAEKLFDACKRCKGPQIYERKMSVDNLGIKTNEKFELKKILIDKSNVTLEKKSEVKTKPNFDTLNESDV